MTLPLVIRAARDGDRGYVLKNWLRSYADAPRAREAGKAYWKGEAQLIERHLAFGDVRVAAFAEDDDVLMGFLCSTLRTLHYVYVYDEYRRQGIATALVTSLPQQFAPEVYSRRTPLSGALRLPSSWRYDPYAGTIFER